ncbi:peptidase A24 N-terminal domain protein, putative prepilin signal peptidase [Campylobacter pinnipediorum subsp. pinnipediorum]|uniref:prepilin peptidase n=1 Tax=Campylobacter pinnipediorum TaxID=1965231 RepID=UPI000995DD81|nr:A24 family peptidase [Campylobacter pinnipediorum]AQW84624.1 peptidase A24 N-terminal domain protein, putative prepilin signal peptidase [Campylobacter pinnipediorum subsp. pinnipediorum]
MDSFDITLSIFLFIFGICFGSFSNVLIYRLPKSQSVSFPSSHCAVCNTPLKWYHNIPIFSWFFLNGKCSFCKTKISIVYPIAELAGGFFMLIGFYKEFGIYVFDIKELILAFIVGLSFINLLALSVIDIRYKAVPEQLLYTGLVLAFTYAVLKNITQNDNFYDNLICSFVFAFAFWLLRFLVSFFLKKEAMGSADIFIATVIGAMLGYKLGLAAVYLSAILTLPVYAIVRKKNYELAFVPFLSLALLLVYCFDDFFLAIIKMIYV